VVNVRDDGKIADEARFHGFAAPRGVC